MQPHPDFAALTAEAQGRVDVACDAFEAAWQGVAVQHDDPAENADRTTKPRPESSHWPAIESFIKTLSPEERVAALRELVPIDVAYRRRCGAPVALGNYSRFEELNADWLTEIVVNPDGRTKRVESSAASRSETSAKPKPPPPSLEVFVERIVTSRLHDRDTVQREVAAIDEGERTAVALGELLVSRGLLTPFQFSSLLRLTKPGLVLGEYIILNPIGRGGMGAVYRARHRRMDRIVAIKVLPPSAARDPQAASRFSREIRAIARLSHPNIVSAHDAGEDSGVAYLVMECIDGTDLATHVKLHGPLSTAHAVDCLLQSAEGLEYAHTQGIIHRDIKPSNLIECRMQSDTTTGSLANASPPRIKVLDLGLARFQAETGVVREATAITHSGMMFGTPEYMSPEQAVNASAVDARADIYSLGCTLFFLLTGRPVLAGQTFLETVMAHQLQALPSLAAARSDVPVELDQIYRRMTARKAEQRYASMSEVIVALKAIPPERLSRVAIPVVSNPVNTRDASNVVGSTEWFAPLQEADPARAATVLITGLDEPPAPQRTSRSPATFAVNWLRQRVPWIAPAIVACGLLVAAGAWMFYNPRSEQPLGGNSNNGSKTARPDNGSVSKPTSPPKPLGFPVAASEVQQSQREWAEYLGSQPIKTDTIGIKLCLIPPGEFLMGTPDEEFEALSNLGIPQGEINQVRFERPAHRVRLSKPFWMSQTEVTIAQFRKFVDAEGYVTDAEKSEGWGVVSNNWTLGNEFNWKSVGEAALTDSHPASNITWNDATAFCDWLSRVESAAASSTRSSGKPVRYRLPTEAEWEYACRAGTATTRPFGSEIGPLFEHAVFSGNSGSRLHPVKTKTENALQLFDMLGNQAEWCLDWSGRYGATEVTDPVGPNSGEQRIQRGGNFSNQAHRVRSAARQPRPQNSPQDGCIRVVREE